MRLRLPGFLRLISALERIADALETRAEIEKARWEEERAVKSRKSARRTEFSVLDVSEVEKRIQKEREASEAGVDIDQ